MPPPKIETVDDTITAWESWGGPSKWTQQLRIFGDLGGKIQYWSGVPRSASAIPLTFALFAPDGTKLPCNYRLRDITNAISLLQNTQKETDR
jgi:hypothetical protein